MAFGARRVPLLYKRPAVVAGGSTLYDDMVAFWEFETLTTDSHSGSLTLTDNNTVGQTTGKVGNAGDFVRANSEFLSVTDSDLSPLGGSGAAFTFACWFNPDDYDTHGIMSHETSDGGTQGAFLRTTGGNAQWQIYGPSMNPLNVTGGALDPSTWYLLVGWCDSGTSYLQVNNGTPVSAAMTGNINSVGHLMIGRNFWNGYANGLIDQAGIWARALSADERTYLYNAGAGRSYAALDDFVP